MKVKSFLLSALLLSLAGTSFANESAESLLTRTEIKEKIRDEIADLDINFSTNLFDIDIADGISLSTKYRYAVEPSYMDQYYTRVDRWRTRLGVSVGDLVPGVIESPFHFSIAKESDIFFVRQFQKRMDALRAMPYTMAKLPLTAKLALRSLDVGDFVAIPANLSISVGAGAGTSWLTGPIGIEARAGVNYVVSGEFTVHVYRIDESRVRLKLMSKRGYSRGANAEIKQTFEIFGVRILDKLVDRLYDDTLGSISGGIHPGGQFMVDYVFDLKDPKAQEAYNQILSSTYKFKDLIVLNKLGNGSELKDKLISSYELADKLFEEDKELENPRVMRIFKGYNNFDGHHRGFKMGLLVASFKKDFTYTESRLSMIDKQNTTHDFYYPLYGEYRETKIGNSIIDNKEQMNKNLFSLVPLNKKDHESVNPDFGLTFERKDKSFTELEQKLVYKFIRAQLPTEVLEQIDLGKWSDLVKKKDVRIFYQIVLKDQAFDYLETLTFDEIYSELKEYVKDRRRMTSADPDTTVQKLKDWFFLTKKIQDEQLVKLANKLELIFADKALDREERAKRLVQLKENIIFNKVGVGFLASLLPNEVLKEGTYIKLEMLADDYAPVKFNYGSLTYKELYDELNKIQNRLSNRSYDLRLNESDIKTE